MPRALKLQATPSLVLPRLMHKRCILAPSLQMLLTCSVPCMRCVRRIVGRERLGLGQLTDVQMRAEMRAPSIDCSLRAARLPHLVRVIMGTRSILCALLRDERLSLPGSGRPRQDVGPRS